MPNEVAAQDPDTGDGSTVTFRFRYFRYILWFTPPWLAVGVAVGVLFITRGHVLLGLSYTFFWILFFGGIFGALALPQNSDIHVNDRELSRSLFGRVWHKNSWDNIQKIRVWTTAATWNPKPLRTIGIYPINKALQLNRIRWIPNIYFLERENIDPLIAILNRNILKHHIPVEDTTGETGKVMRTQI